ncbi:MAG: hypothetical protein JW768_02135 [Chitinispirillaceae bacterium]|nr:hypothetical protein [Chitinispirillaceae bacterium]
MKNTIILLVVLAVIVAGIFVVMKLRVTADINTAVAAEQKGDFPEAVMQYTDALLKVIPSLVVPDVNHAKVISQEAWKKEMADYSEWLLGSSTPKVDMARRNELLDAVNRNIVHVQAQNFTNKDSVMAITVEQYSTIWNNAFFARGVTPDPAHAGLAASCYEKGLSLVRLNSLTSYEYELAIVDTAYNRSTTITLPPEDKVFFLARPGSHLLVCKSKILYPGGKIWRSTPTLIPLSIPDTVSFITARLETHVERKPGEKPMP